MDAVKFLEEYKRMCDSNDSCDSCDADGQCIGYGTNNAAGIVAIVEKWSKKYSRKTRQSVFLEHWPEAELVNGCLAICPKRISANYRNGNADCANRSCADCLYKFWMQEVRI